MSDYKVKLHSPVWYSEQRVIAILMGTLGIDSLPETNRPENRRTYMREICMYVLDLYTPLHTRDFSIMFNTNLSTVRSSLCKFKKQLDDGLHPKSNKIINQIMYSL